MRQRLFWYSAVLLAVIPGNLLGDTLRGVVEDEQGKPIAGARIDVAVAAPKVGQGIFCPSCYLDCKKWTRTNENGEFEIEGLDPKLNFRILSTASGKQTQMTNLVDPSKETVNLVLQDFPGDTPQKQILKGRIVSVDGTPIPGALIDPHGARTTEKRWWGAVEIQPAVSDDDGYFRMLIPEPNYLGVDIKVLADGYAGTSLALLAPGPKVHEIKVPIGTNVTGKLAFKGVPQAGVRVAVVQTSRSMETHFIKSVMALTDGNGRFEFHSLPASQEYVIYSPVGEADPQILKTNILTTKRFNCLADGQSRDLGTLELMGSCSVSGKLEMSDGSRLPGGLRMTLARNPAWDLIEVAVDQDGVFEINGLPPETYEFVINPTEIRLDPSRLNLQQVRSNSCAIRLAESREGILIPILPDKPAVTKTARTKPIATNEPESIVAVVTSDKKLNEVWEVGSGTDVELTDEPVPADGPKIQTRGIVTNAKGERIAGAMVLLRGQHGGQFYSNGTLTNRDVLARTRTDANGRFVFANVPIPLRMQALISGLLSQGDGKMTRSGPDAQLLAYMDGYGLAAADVNSSENNDPMRIVLGPEADVRGVVRDESGTGIANARVEIWGMTGVSGPISHVLGNPGDLNLGMSQLDRVSRTGADGSFEIKHLPVDRRVIVNVTADGFVRRSSAIETTMPQNGIRKQYEEDMWNDRITVQQSPAEIKLEAKPTLQVRVVDHDGQPARDGIVEMAQIEGNQPKTRQSNPISPDTGLATFLKPDPGQWKIRYETDALHPRIAMSLSIKDGNEAISQPIELQLPQSRWVTGRVTNLETGVPVVGASIVSSWEESKEDDVMVFCRAISRENGEFRIPAVVGKNRIAIIGQLYGFFNEAPNRAPRRMAGTVVDVPSEGEIPSVELTMSPGLIVEGTVRTESGKPITQALVRAVQDRGGYVFWRTNAEGTYRITGLSPSISTDVSVAHAGVATQKTIEAAANDSVKVRHETIDLMLEPKVQLTGRVTKNGKPQAGVKMELFLHRSVPGQPNSYRVINSATAKTDENGRYTLGGLSPGDNYSFKITTLDGSVPLDWKHGEGYSHTLPANAVGVIELPDAVLVASNQALAGMVIDPDGQPVAGIHVGARLGTGRPLMRRDNLPAPWTETDQAGKFKLSHLPDEDIELMAYKTNPGGNQIPYPVTVTAERNQSDIRIVLDPKLLDDIENLDPVKAQPPRRAPRQRN